jgi:GPH family glycoside/pentoside/hexuronide:cation symporter
MMDRRLSLRVKLGFGICDLGGNLFFTVMGFYLLYFFTDQIGLLAGLAGTALMIGKFWDAVTDPLVGGLSDGTKSRWGRRRPWMFVGAFLLFFTMVLMFLDPKIQSQGPLFLWAAGVYCLVNTAYTLVNIPYGALTPELTSDYNERSVLNGYRQVFAVMGTFIGAALVMPIIGAFSDSASGWLAMAAVMGAIMLLSALVTVFTVKENPDARLQPSEGIFASYGAVLKQKPFLLALIPWALHITGVTIIQSSMVYYFQYIYRNKEAFQLALVLLLASAMICIPLWVKLSKKVGKRNAYNLGMLIFASAVLVFFFFGHTYGLSFAYGLMAAAGVGFAAQYAMPYAILPDVVEYDYAENGKKREGIYYGLWTFISKVGQSFAIALSGWVLALSGYLPGAASQPESAVLGIRLLAGIIPAAFFLAGAAVHSFYPIDKAYYDTLVEKIRRNEA